MSWGKLVIINLYDCDEKSIKNKKEINKFVEKLCKKINMIKFGSPKIKRFGKSKLKGYSVMQFIETSSITIHFDEEKNRAFIDIFSCKNFNSRDAERFSRDFFKAKKSKRKVLLRK